MPRIFRFLPLLVLLAMLPSVVYAQVAGPTIDVLHAEGTINPVLVDYIERGISRLKRKMLLP